MAETVGQPTVPALPGDSIRSPRFPATDVFRPRGSRERYDTRPCLRYWCHGLSRRNAERATPLRISLSSPDLEPAGFAVDSRTQSDSAGTPALCFPLD